MNNICPKADRCKHAAECVIFDTFRGEYLCFENKAQNLYELALERRKENDGERKSKSLWDFKGLP